jgi:hypothetical protein
MKTKICKDCLNLRIENRKLRIIKEAKKGDIDNLLKIRVKELEVEIAKLEKSRRRFAKAYVGFSQRIEKGKILDERVWSATYGFNKNYTSKRFKTEKEAVAWVIKESEK